MGEWVTKTAAIVLGTFVAAYVGFFVLCALSYQFASPQQEPVPALLVGIPVGFVAALIALIFRLVQRDPEMK